MNRTLAFTQLDFITVKPYFTIKNMAIYIVLVLVITMFSGSVASAIAVGMMLSTMFLSYPFTLSEKSNMDALYVTLSVSRKTVVLGRYLFVLGLNLCAIVFALLLSLLSLPFAKYLPTQAAMDMMLWAVLAMAMIFLILQAFQLPVYFRFGYAKARFFSLVPVIALLAAYFAFMTLLRDAVIVDALSGFLTGLQGTEVLVIAAAVVVLVLVVFLSIRLSQAFYAKREF